MTKRQWRRIRGKIIKNDPFDDKLKIIPFFPKLMDWYASGRGYSWKRKNHR